MKVAQINHPDLGLDYRTASVLATSLADADADIIDPVMVVWHDRKSSQMSPMLEGCVTETNWRDYGMTHGGKLEIEVNGEYDFVFADSSAFESYGPNPYINLHDLHGKEYLCNANAFRDPHNPKNPSRKACTALDE